MATMPFPPAIPALSAGQGYGKADARSGREKLLARPVVPTPIAVTPVTDTPRSARRKGLGDMNRIALASTTGIVAAGLAALAGCSPVSGPAAARPAATVTVTATAAAAHTAPAARTTTPVAAAATSGTSAPPATPAPAASPSTSAAGAIPTLGRPAGVFARGAGFGLVRPARIFNGGDPTGLVTGIAWASWGGASATGTGTSEYVGSGQSVATGREETATVVAFDLGPCDGRLMYRAVEWYFPQHGQAFRVGQYEDICTGSYVPAS